MQAMKAGVAGGAVDRAAGEQAEHNERDEPAVHCVGASGFDCSMVAGCC
jgi:hypothetical protein